MERDCAPFSSYALSLISTHTLTWSVTWSIYSKWPIWKFQLTRSRGAWRVFQACKRSLWNFNSHAHVERDVNIIAPPTLQGYFNSHAHVERDPFNNANCQHDNNFNSHAHVERDKCLPVLLIQQYISTHTLTWSVTMNEHFASGLTNISTHTLTWSVTLWQE